MPRSLCQSAPPGSDLITPALWTPPLQLRPAQLSLRLRLHPSSPQLTLCLLDPLGQYVRLSGPSKSFHHLRSLATWWALSPASSPPALAAVVSGLLPLWLLSPSTPPWSTVLAVIIPGFQHLHHCPGPFISVSSLSTILLLNLLLYPLPVFPTLCQPLQHPFAISSSSSPHLYGLLGGAVLSHHLFLLAPFLPALFVVMVIHLILSLCSGVCLSLSPLFKFSSV